MTILRSFALALALLALAACEAPSQHDAQRFGTLRVTWSADDWASSYRNEFGAALVAASRLGPDVVFVTDGADVTVAHWESPDCARVAAGWDAAARVVRIDPVCARGNIELRAILIHELGHALGMVHVCRYAGELASCSPVGIGVAVLNPALVYGDDPGPGADEAYAGPIASDSPTELDLAELRRVRPPR